jgi:hypothetical protein
MPRTLSSLTKLAIYFKTAGARLYLAPHVAAKTKTKGAEYNSAPASLILRTMLGIQFIEVHAHVGDPFADIFRPVAGARRAAFPADHFSRI